MVAGACCRRCCSRSTPPGSARCCFAASCSPPPTTSVQRTAFSCAPRHCTRRAAHLPLSAQSPRVAVHMDGPTRIHPPRGQPRLDPRPARRLRRRVHQRQRRLPRLRAREAPSLRRGARVWPFAHIQRRAGGRQRVGSARPCERRRRVASVARPLQITTTSSAFSLWRHRSRRTDGRARRRPTVSLAMAFASTATDNPQTAEHPRDA